jgi:hypothetical protein
VDLTNLPLALGVATGRVDEGLDDVAPTAPELKPVPVVRRIQKSRRADCYVCDSR